MLKRLAIAIGAALAVITTSLPSRAETPETLWRQLRQAFPYNTQEIAVSEDGKVVIVTEPPPNTSAAQIAEVLGATSHQVLRHSVGFDGWVADVVLEIGDLTQSELRERLARLAILMYSSAYQANFITVPITSPSVHDKPELDVVVGADDLYRWLIKEAMPLHPSIGGAGVPAATLLGQPTSGVYVSEPPGLVAWAIPRGDELQSHAPVCRQWLMESDLVLGGLRGAKCVLVVGRSRQIDVDILPPLRVEEVMRLAAVSKDELAQSYERNHPLAGRWSGKKYHDWAPIYLSAELLDSEYGSLLNLTDQLLKSWSESGNTEYVNFAYPKPATWPFEQPLSQLMPGSSLTFNWNTTGVGHTTQYDNDLTVFALRRTGALPVSYIPEGLDEDVNTGGPAPDVDVAAFEERAYEYFARSRDVHLARVVQYAALYQLFTAFDLHSSISVRREIPPAGADLLRQKIEEALVKIRDADTNALDRLTTDFGQYAAKRHAAQASDDDNAELAFTMEMVAYLGSLATQAELRELSTEFGPSAVGDIAGMLAHPELDAGAQQRLAKALELFFKDEAEIEEAFEALPESDRKLVMTWGYAQMLTSPEATVMREFVGFLADVDRTKDEYARAFQDAREPGWIRTPSIVLSRDAAEPALIGGHNLGSQAGSFVVDPKVPRGEPRIIEFNGRTVIRMHPDDAAGIGMAWRRIERSGDPALELPRILADARKSEAKLPREMPARLRIVPAADGGGRGSLPPGRVRLGNGPADPGGPGARYPVDPNSHVVLVADSSRRYTSDGRTYFEAATNAALVDALIVRARQWNLKPGDTMVVRAARDVLSDGELAGLVAGVHARRPPGVVVRYELGHGSDLLNADFRGAVVENVRETGSPSGRVYVCDIRLSLDRRAQLEVDSARAIDDLSGKVQRGLPRKDGAQRNANEVFIDLQKVKGLEDLQFKMILPGETRLDGIWISDSFDGSEGNDSRWWLCGPTSRAA